MKSVKTVFVLFAALVPILYFGGMAYFLSGAPARLEGAVGLPSGATGGMTKELGPTVLGLTGFAVLFGFVFVIRAVRMASRTPSTPRANAVELEDDEPFDADAALARYMARKAAGGEGVTEPAPETPAVAPLGFGRKPL